MLVNAYMHIHARATCGVQHHTVRHGLQHAKVLGMTVILACAHTVGVQIYVVKLPVSHVPAPDKCGASQRHTAASVRASPLILSSYTNFEPH